MKTKSPSEIRDKKKQIKAKLSIRQIGKTPPKVKKWPTGELELFKKVAEYRKYYYANWFWWYVDAKHINKYGKLTKKDIRQEDLTPTNFSHTIPKSRGEEYRLDPNNIEIVSRAWHHYEHTKQILQIDYPN